MIARVQSGALGAVAEFQALRNKVRKRIGEKVPGLPPALRDLAAEAVAYVKLESEHSPTKVGTRVFVSVVARGSREVYSGTV